MRFFLYLALKLTKFCVGEVGEFYFRLSERVVGNGILFDNLLFPCPLCFKVIVLDKEFLFLWLAYCKVKSGGFIKYKEQVGTTNMT